jgi:hypothetical protein
MAIADQQRYSSYTYMAKSSEFNLFQRVSDLYIINFRKYGLTWNNSIGIFKSTNNTWLLFG